MPAHFIFSKEFYGYSCTCRTIHDVIMQRPHHGSYIIQHMCMKYCSGTVIAVLVILPIQPYIMQLYGYSRIAIPPMM